MQMFRHAFGVVALAVATLAAGGEEPLQLIDVKQIDPTIIVSLRYAMPNNITGRALYPRNMPALVQSEAARRLAR